MVKMWFFAIFLDWREFNIKATVEKLKCSHKKKFKKGQQLLLIVLEQKVVLYLISSFT